MTAAEELYRLIQTLPEDQITKILYFTKSLQQGQQGIEPRKESNRLFAFLTFAVIAAFALPIIPYIWNFWKGMQGLSPNPDDWASFGDYLGGTANSILSFINLALVSWLAFRIFQLETSFSMNIFQQETYRAKELQSLSVKPICNIYPSDYENRIEIALINRGLGPGKITKLKFFYKPSSDHNTQEFDNLIDLMPDQPANVMYSDYKTGVKGQFLPVGERMSLILLEGNTDDPIFTEYRDQVRKVLKDVTFDLEYSNMFDEFIGRERIIFSIYGKHFE